MNCGYLADEVWGWTPRQMSAVAEIAQKLERRKRASDLSLASMAARGETDAVRKLIRDWSQ